MSLEHTTHQTTTHSTELAPSTAMRGGDLHSIAPQGLAVSDRGGPGGLAASAYSAGGSDANGARGALDHSTNRVLADIDRALGPQGGPLSSSELVASAHRLPEVREPAAPSIGPSETSGPFDRQTHGPSTTDQAQTRQAPPENAGQDWQSQVREAGNDKKQSPEAEKRAQKAQRESDARAKKTQQASETQAEKFQRESDARIARARQEAEDRKNQAETQRLLREALIRQEAEKRQRENKRK